MLMPESDSNNAGTCAAIAAMSPVSLLAPAVVPLPVETIVILSTFASGLADTTYQNQFQNALNSYTQNYNTALGQYQQNYGTALGEYQESVNKAKAGLKALAMAKQF